MSGSKRQRQLAREKYERQQSRRVEQADRRRRNQRITAIVVVAVLAISGIGFVIVSNQGSPDATSATEALPSESASTEVLPSEPAANATPASGDAEPVADTSEPIEEPSVLDCGPALPTRPNDTSFDAPGDVEAAASITFTTTCGDIVVALDERAPETVRSATFLAEQGFYDATACHRLTTEGLFVLQCGDPAGDGTGGPGYELPDENLPAQAEANYPAGTVAMANAGPGTSGSQFFLVYEDTTLPPAYTILGTITQGLDIVQEIASVGTEDGTADARPRQPMIIEKATVERS